MPTPKPNRYRAALEILQRGRDRLVEELADQVLDQADDLLESGFLFNEFLENQGTRLHFLSLLVAQLEQSAEQHEEPQDAATTAEYEEFRVQAAAPAEPPKRKRKSRSKKLTGQASREGEPGET